jgi:1-acyl-sn-glycerol-3-phosphate acyltransferase
MMDVMLPAKKSPFWNKVIYSVLMKPALRGSFHAVHYRQAQPLPPDLPVILFGNHSAWWDGHLPLAANEERWHRDGYVMVEDTQLARYGFFRYAGAFSVNRHDGRSAMQSVAYAVDKLTEAPNRMLLIFPQGEILANDVRPLKFFPGIGHIVKKAAQAGPVALLPFALRYEFIGEQKPDAFISVGAPVIAIAPVDAKVITAQMEAALTHELDCLREDITAYRFGSFETLVAGAWGINRIWDAVRGKGQIKEVGRDTSPRP